MAFVIADRVKERTTTTGTGTVTLTGAATGFQSFSAIGNANTTYYAIVSQTGTEWEVGLGTYTSSGTTLARTTVIASSNGGSAVNFSAGTKDVFVTYPSGRAVLANSSLTSGRVPYATTSGFLTDSANLLYSGTDLTVYGLTVGRGGGAISTNTAVGASALAATATGASNTAIGEQAGKAILGGINNTTCGRLSLSANTTGSFNSAFGAGDGSGAAALRLNVSGNNNSAFGAGALASNTASDNTAVGLAAAYSNTSGANNTAQGYQALYYNLTASNNTAVGYQALFSNVTGTRLVAMGYIAGTLNTGSFNTFIGAHAGAANTSGASNTFIGDFAGNTTTGGSNTFVGQGAGQSITTGSKNTIIGMYNGSAAPISATGSNFIVLSDGDGNARQIIDSSGNVLIGTTSQLFSAMISVVPGGARNGLAFTMATGFESILTNNPSAAAYTFGDFRQNNTVVGTIAVGTTTTSYNTTSDYRLKNSVAPMVGALAKVAALKPVTYKWNLDGSDGEGFIAHELAEVCPYAVTGAKNAVDAEGNPKYQGVDVSFLIATLTAAIQELKAEFDAYKSTHP
jgi:hypothetical protein